MKILFIAGNCHPGTQGGIQTFGRALKKMFKDELSFISYKIDDSKKIYSINDNFEIKELNIILKILNKLCFNKIREKILEYYIKKICPDICILSSPQNLKSLNNITCKKILVQHTQLDRYFSNKNYYANDRKLLELSKDKLDYFIVTSPKDKKKWIEEYNFPENKVKLIRHSCEINLKNEKKIKNKTLIMIARLENRVKRFDLAIRAMKNLSEYELKIYGSGLDRKYLENIVEKESLKNVKFCGITNTIEKELDNSSIFVLTSDVEGYPISAIEAMRRGLPIIVRDTFEGASDVVINNGILLKKEWNAIQFSNKIKEIYKNYEIYSKNSIEMGKRHDINIIKSKWESLFKALNIK